MPTESPAPVSSVSSVDVHAFLRVSGILRLALPLMIGSGMVAIQQCLDRVFLGDISAEALAASFPAMMTNWVMMCFFVQTGSYLGTFVSQHHGAQEYKLVGAMCWPALLCACFGAVLCLLSIPCMPWIASCFHASPLIELHISDLCIWYAYGALPSLLAVVWSSFFAAIGRVRLVMVISSISVAFNIFFNYVLSSGELGFPALGVNGIGLGTFIAQLAAALLYSVFFFTPRNCQHYHILSQVSTGLKRLGIFLKYTTPNGLREVMEAGSWHFLFITVAHFGTVALASANIFMGWYFLFFAPLMGMVQALSIAVGHCCGSDNRHYIPRVVAASLVIAISYACIWYAIYMFAGASMVSPFLGAGDEHLAEIHTLTISLFFIGGVWGIADAVQLLLRGAINATGDVRWTLIATPVVYLTCLVLPCWYLIADYQSGARSVCGLQHTEAVWCIAVSSLIALSLTFYYRFRQGTWKHASVRS